MNCDISEGINDQCMTSMSSHML